MAERTFFTLRYALPGYIFLITITLMNWTTMYSMFSDEKSGAIFSALFAFFYLLSGSAVGFLVSQLWYIYFNKFHHGKYGFLRKLNIDLKGKLKTKNDVDSHVLLIFSDYIERLSESKNMLIYAQRRWNLIHIFGSTISALSFGLVTGLIYYHLKVGVSVEAIKDNWSLIGFAVFLIIVIYVCLILGIRHALKEHSMAKLIIVKEVLHKPEKSTELKEIFHECFQNQSEKRKP